MEFNWIKVDKFPGTIKRNLENDSEGDTVVQQKDFSRDKLRETLQRLIRDTLRIQVGIVVNYFEDTLIFLK